MKISQIHIVSIIAVIIFITFVTTVAQVPTTPVKEKPKTAVSVIAKSFGDSIMLRFAPNTIESWLNGNKYGYSVYRYLVVENEKNVIDHPERILLSENPALPLPLDTIEKYYRSDGYAGIVAQAIYGSSFELDAKGKSSSMINLASELSNRYSFSLFACDMSVNAARSHGLLYVDKNIKYGNKYLYCIKPNRPDTFSVADSAVIFVAVNDTFTTPVPVGIYAGFKDMAVTVSWDNESMEQVFSAYNVERSDDGGKTFHVVNREPVINISAYSEKPLRRMMYIDTIPQNEKEYFYRVRGITPFGEMSPPSDTVSGMGTQYLVGINPIINGSGIKNRRSLVIQWEFPEEYEEYVKGFTVERADMVGGHYVQLSDTLNRTVRTFTDTSANNVNYYQVRAISKAGNVFCSFPSLVQLPDSIPPAAPAGLTGTVDSSGIVTLRWNRNYETDLMSYRIYRSNRSDTNFILANHAMVTDTSFIDTISLNNLTKRVYYAVSAQDKNYNESQRSASFKILKPDTIPPVAPVIKDIRTSENAVIINWIASSSEDAVKNLLYRRKEGEREWVLAEVKDQKAGSGAIKDTDVAGGIMYEYMMIAVDESGLESINNRPLTIRTRNVKTESELNIIFSKATDGKSVKLSWNIKDSNIQRIYIYKSTAGGPVVLYKTFDPGIKKFIDSEIKAGTLYKYYTQITDKNGLRSKMSEGYLVQL